MLLFMTISTTIALAPIPMCEYEDTIPEMGMVCMWDNGSGQSFIALDDGRVIYLNSVVEV